MMEHPNEINAPPRTGEVGINFNRSVNYTWPGARGKAGAAKPHAMIFVGSGHHKKEKDDDEKEDD